MSAVPRKHEAHVSGLERARIGTAAADARQGSARADALSVARSSALRAFDLPAFADLAAANLDYSAKVLLELMGQGARGPCRTRAWIMRNGARIEKGERGLAVSMFGAYVWPLRSTSGRFGSVGIAVDGEASSDEVAGWTAVCGGDVVAAAILVAMRGYHLVSVDVSDVTVERLDTALAVARGVAWKLPACLSCDGDGCVLCSCQDDKSRVAVVDCNAMPATPKPDRSVAAPKRRGRPPAVRPDIPDVALAMREVRRLRDEADRLRLEAAELERRAMQSAWSKHSLADIAAASGVTRGRVHQIVQSR